jgi:hypothetical protein
MKFSGFEKYLIVQGLNMAKEQAITEIREQISKGEHPIMTEGFIDITVKETLNKLNNLSVKD